jgi:acyl-coenzyme A thioesterase PaaI-like protein
MPLHKDFEALPWVHTVLSDSSVQIKEEVDQTRKQQSVAPNPMFNKVLFRQGAISAHLNFKRSSREADAVGGHEECMLMSLGNDLDGKHGRAHGGFDSLVLDTMLGTVSNHAVVSRLPPATATMTIDFHAPVNTPSVVLVRAWLLEVSGRKVWSRGVIEDGEGKVLASGKALFIVPRDSAL